MLEDLIPKDFSQELLLEWAISIGMAILVFIIGRIVANIVVKIARHAMAKGGMDSLLINFVGSILKWVLMLFVIIASLEQLGVDTTSLVALLGAAGIAVGLALKDSLQNFASGVMLIVFRPFKEGDFIEAGGVMGVVEHIGIFTTNMKTPDNKEVIVPNGQVYSGAITNFSAKATRRVDMVFGIAYDADIRQAKNILVEIMQQDERVLPEPAPVVAVSELADSSVNFVVRPWVKAADFWGVMWDTTEKVKYAFDEAGIGIPFPQMELHMNKPESDDDAPEK
ncbi:mechanosensitive ion channel [Ketobacter sp. MCCC 1A13808]|uniref:mechanosensitive ion channel family protein n=1 Tax=Ketobacter sp. MCCC 1A13808 TaxID=2602738 RepID=UPI000F14B7C6|nr:mechanosensitive ion channel domain-containing protein [Ketobacter sp. MCCC 1A13808]MVF12595.1 mechanosensitive ion channel [Ketobacter sp. MCCC 1A13808]RLP55605.1 MAG: mechanosensitive ion channel family protein [Ketobacter sp.]